MEREGERWGVRALGGARKWINRWGGLARHRGTAGEESIPPITPCPLTSDLALVTRRATESVSVFFLHAPHDIFRFHFNLTSVPLPPQSLTHTPEYPV